MDTRTHVSLALTSLLAAVLASAGVAQEAGAGPRPEDPRIERAKARFDFAAWPASEERWDGVPLAALAYPGFVPGDLDFSADGLVTRTYGGEDGRPRFRIEIAIRDTAAAAREALLADLASLASPRPVPTAANAGVAAGDIGFVGFAPRDRIAWVAFARGNVAVRVASFDPRTSPHPDLRAVAELTDRLLRARPALAPGTPLARPAIAELRPARTSCRAGEVVPLDVAAGEILATAWIVGGAGQGYVEPGADGRWALHTTKAGRIDLTCRVLGANGLVAARSVAIEVGEE
ncbi:MAG: hypothetical protein AB1726_03785 [Planctomycetota bacterium]